MTYCLPRQLQIREETKNLVSTTTKQQLELGCRENIRERQWTNSWSRGVGSQVLQVLFLTRTSYFNSLRFGFPSARWKMRMPAAASWGWIIFAEARAVKSHTLDHAQLTSASFSSALLPASPSLAPPLCFPRPTQGVRRRVTAPNARAVARWDAPLHRVAWAFHCSVWRAKSHALWAFCSTSKARWLQLWPLYEALPLLSELKMLSRGTGTRYDPAPLHLHLTSAQLHLWELSDYQLSPPFLALNERVCKAAGAFSLLHSPENPW